MTGSQVIPFCKKLLFVFLLILAPSDGLRLHTFLSLKAKRITHFYSVALLLEKWFACFPTSGDGLQFAFYFYSNNQVILFKNMNSFFLDVSFSQTRWQANCVFRSIATRKRNETLRLWPGRTEPCEAIGASLRTAVRIFKSCILCRILHSFPYCFMILLPTAFSLRSRMTAGI